MDSRFRRDFQDLEASLSRLTTADEKMAKLVGFMQDLSGSTENVHTPAQHDAIMAAQWEAINDLADRHGLSTSKLMELVVLSSPESGNKPPLKHLLCADQDVSQLYNCQNPGTLSCSGCLLVRYCSKECQKRHWPSHKQDCKNRLNSSSWRPEWEVEGRTPAFVHDGIPIMPHVGKGTDMSLWGNMPAIDIVNGFKAPDALRSRNLSLAFVASGDLRNVIKSVNSLPEDYTGELNILLNDHNPRIVARNFLILSILALVNDIESASELALHLWYSVFLPMNFRERAFLPIYAHDIMAQDFGGAEIQLTPNTTMSTTFGPVTAALILESTIAEIDIDTANNALTDVMNASERVHYRDRVYYSLKPAHRVAFQEFKCFGIIMPFGAYNAHLSVPNPTLVTPNGELFLHDTANPLNGWNLSDLLKAGIAHGTTEEDIMGCFYFYVKDQLETFAIRLRQFNIKIRMYNQDALKLPAALPFEIQRYDRIEVSNILDKYYCGLEKVLETWGSCLNRAQTDSALIGLLMNWVLSCSDGSPRSSPKIASECAMKLKSKMPKWGIKLDPSELAKRSSATNLRMIPYVELVFDNSKVFRKYLEDNKANVAARKAGIKMREINEIVPHRVGARLGSTWDALPDIKDSEDLYRISMAGATYSERYVEWTVDKQ